MDICWTPCRVVINALYGVCACVEEGAGCEGDSGLILRKAGKGTKHINLLNPSGNFTYHQV
jgi:hypothetical protein